MRSVWQRSCGKLALAAVLLALVVSAARAGELERIYAELLHDPLDVALNLRYARLAEARGEKRKALAAYERALAAEPGNREARQGLRRLKLAFEPAVTRGRLEVGTDYETNPRNLPDSLRRPDDVYGVARLTLFDQRPLLGHLWRTRLSGYGELHGEIESLDFGRLRVHTGPVFDLPGERRLHVAPGGSTALLDDRHFYSQGTLRLTLDNAVPGVFHSIDLRGGYRDVDSAFLAEDGYLIDLFASHRSRGLAVEGDAFYFYPRFRYREPDDGGAAGAGLPNRFLLGDFIELGALAYYFFPLAGELYLGTSLSAHYRNYDEPVRFGTGEREDGFVAPGLELLFTNLFCDGCDLRLRYRFEHNFSNDWTEVYSSHTVGLRAVRRF